MGEGSTVPADHSVGIGQVRLGDLSEAVTVDKAFLEFVDNRVTRIVAAHDLAAIEQAQAGDFIVLDPALDHAVTSYRFDLVVARARGGVAAIAGGEPGPTGRRVAARAGIALVTVADGHDVASLAVLLRDLSRGREQADLTALERVVQATESCTGTDEIDRLLVDVGRSLARPVRLVHALSECRGRPIRIQGMVRWSLEVDGNDGGSLIEAALSHVTRHIEGLLQAEYDARELPEATRAELVNEILLSDVGMWSDAAGRLRQAEFPIDGSHCAVRIDCNHPNAHPNAVGSGADVAAAYRTQQRIAELALEGARRTGGTWTRAGTVASILLVSSRTTSHGELVSREVGEAARLAVASAGPALDGLQLHVGVGTPHLGVAGLRTTVNEATTAVRSAREVGRVDEPHHFDRLGFSRALLQWAEIDGVRAVLNEILAPILDQPPGRAREALDTLRVYLENGRNMSTTAAALHLHRNTIRYRIDRINALLSVDLDDPDERLLVELGCRLVATELAT